MVCRSASLFFIYVLFFTWFPSPDSGLHGELDDGDSVVGELIVEKRSLEAKIVTRQKNRPLPTRRGVATQRWCLDVSGRRICKAWIVEQSESFSNTNTLLQFDQCGNDTYLGLLRVTQTQTQCSNKCAKLHRWSPCNSRPVLSLQTSGKEKK